MQINKTLLIKNGFLLSPLIEITVRIKTEQIQEPNNQSEQDAVGSLEILEIYEDKNTKTTLKDFVNLYNSRYSILQGMLRQRQELQAAIAIRKAESATDNETISIIGIILEKNTTKNDNIILTLEDQTGVIKCIISKNRQDIYKAAKDLAEDEVIGLTGTKKEDIIFATSIINPDVPLTKELKKSPKDEAAVFISDLHIGSKSFLRGPMEKFFSWIRMDTGTDAQKEQVKKIKYLFIIGDIVDGVGVYPDQEKDLEIKDVHEQIALFESYILTVPEHIKIIICPGFKFLVIIGMMFIANIFHVCMKFFCKTFINIMWS